MSTYIIPVNPQCSHFLLYFYKLKIHPPPFCPTLTNKLFAIHSIIKGIVPPCVYRKFSYWLRYLRRTRGSLWWTPSRILISTREDWDTIRACALAVTPPVRAWGSTPATLNPLPRIPSTISGKGSSQACSRSKVSTNMQFLIGIPTKFFGIKCAFTVHTPQQFLSTIYRESVYIFVVFIWIYRFYKLMA